MLDYFRNHRLLRYSKFIENLCDGYVLQSPVIAKKNCVSSRYKKKGKTIVNYQKIQPTHTILDKQVRRENCKIWLEHSAYHRNKNVNICLRCIFLTVHPQTNMALNWTNYAVDFDWLAQLCVISFFRFQYWILFEIRSYKDKVVLSN